MKKVVFLANNNIGSGLSGGDRIYTEFLRHWRGRLELTLLGSEEACSMAATRGISGFRFLQSDTRNVRRSPYTLPGLLRHIARRLYRGLAAVRANWNAITEAEAVYSISDAYPDCLAGAYIKRRRGSAVTWIAGFYMFAPHPLSADTPYKGRHWLRGALYWLMQIPSYHLIRRYADYVLVTSQPDVKPFVTTRRSASRVIVVQGGVDITESERYLQSAAVAPVDQRTYDACFIGRFHFQKGVLELVDIWQKVVAQKKDARLAMIGEGALRPALEARIAALGLQDHITILGFLDGAAKFEVFKQSRLMVHPATYDSGGMAAAEGMAWRLPAVGFDLEALKTYYPQGMLKAAPGNLDQFASLILSLLADRALYERQADAAHALIVEVWDWKKRAQRVCDAVFGAAA
ncbi:MAG: glycosyltransferase family 4 protein [Verrucomicrobia bacterium]|nr:glycosyltransferase family 4 protein [Verrucomicrobiota bacterium]